MNTKSKITILLIFILCLGSTNSLRAQDRNPEKAESIHLLGHAIEGKILLRWGPSDYDVWQKVNTSGIILQRAVVPQGDLDYSKYDYDSSFTKTIKPLAQDDPQWESILDQDDYATAAWASLHEEKPQVTGNLASMINEQDNANKKAFFIGMLAADHSHLAAKAMGLGYEDTEVVAGQKYFYKISLVSDSTLSDIELVDYSANIPAETSSPPKTESQEKAVMLSWSRNNDGGNFTSYIIERAENKNGPFTQIINTPYLSLNPNPNSTSESFATHLDSVGVNYKPFFYRITGISPFGLKGQPSEAIMGMGVDLTPPSPPYNLTIEDQPDKTIKLLWNKDKNERDFKGFIVSKSDDYDGPYQALHEGELPYLTNSIVDKNPGIAKRNFYSVAAIDTAGNVSTTLVKIGIISDDSRIQTPSGLTGSIDTNGVVTLTWEKSTDPRVIGYKVYSSNSPNHSFLMKPGDPIKETTYSEKITLRTLSEKIIYKVAALSNGFAYSELSEGLELNRPDIIAPSFGVFKGREIKDTCVILNWAISHTHDLIEQQLWRKNGSKKWSLLKSFDATVDTYVDNTLEPGVEYIYALKSVDDAGLESDYSPIISASLSAYQALEPVKNVKVVYNEESKETVLSWEYPNSNSYDFLVYKSVDTPNLSAIKKVQGSQSYNDKRIQKDKKYSYGVRVISKDGKESSISDTAIITIH